MMNTRIAGIPCIVEITHYFRQPPFKGSAWNCDSDLDFYGYVDIEYNILDRKGYRAAWLEKKMTDEDRKTIEQEIMAYMEDNDNY